MMDFEEFQESDVMFSDYSSEQSNENNKDENRSSNGPSRRMTRRLKSKKSIPKIQRGGISSSSSLPVNIPSRDNSFRYDDDDDVECSEMFDEDSDDNVDQEMRLPPHIIIERRFSGEIARSFSPLKGRNLSQVRDSILRITGFLER